MRDLSGLRQELEPWQSLQNDLNEALELLEMAGDENDQSIVDEIGDQAEELARKLDKLEFELTLPAHTIDATPSWPYTLAPAAWMRKIGPRC